MSQIVAIAPTTIPATCVHGHMHACTHARTYTHTPTHTLVDVCLHLDLHAHIHRYTPVDTCTGARRHTCAAHSCMHIRIHTHCIFDSESFSITAFMVTVQVRVLGL